MVQKRFFTDEDGYDAVFLDPDDTEDFAIDISRKLPSGVTVSSATFTADGVTVEDEGVSGFVASFFLTGLTSDPAEVTVQFVLSNGGLKSHTIRVYKREH